MLKHEVIEQIYTFEPQPPSGGCVLKLRLKICATTIRLQPPSGGCVLKLFEKRQD